MVSKPFFQNLKPKTILVSVTFASLSASASIASTVNADGISRSLTNPSTQIAPSQAAPSQIAQAAAITYPTLQLGSTGETVSRLQATLKLLGFYRGEIDGNYSQLTQQAVISFQSAANLTADGIAGPNTWRTLLPTPSDIDSDIDADTASDTAPPESEASTDPTPEETATDPDSSGPPILRPSAEGTAVSQLQRELQTLGYYNSAIDGKYGELTEAAVREFQADQQLTVDAIVGPSTWDALSRALEN